MFKLLSDTFIINEIIDSNTSEALLENEISISENMPDIEKIISTEGKIKINSATVHNNSVTVNGDLVHNIIYRSNDEDVSVASMSGKINFTEEIQMDGATEGMEAQVNSYIDYIDSELLSEKNFLIKAVANIDVDLVHKRPVDFISSLESDGSFQAKTKNIVYTDIVSHSTEEITVSDSLELNQSADKVKSILKSDCDAYITNVDIMNDRMLVEGICKVGFLYTEDNNLSTTGYVSEEFPFTHYIELKNSNPDMLRDINVNFNDLSYTIDENYDDEDKIVSFTANFTIDAKLYDTVEKNIILDGYSTDSEIEIDSSKINLVSTRGIKDVVTKYENNFDVMTGTIKDIYTIDISPKVSEKRVFDNKYVVDGFLDVNLLYLNGDVNKIDRAYVSMPYTATVDLSDEEKDCDIVSDVKISKCSAYRKGNNSVVVNCDIKVDMKMKKGDEISIISNINEIGPIDYGKMPSLIFRVVQQGETIWDIAKNYSVSINYLRELNELSEDDALIPGDKIIIARRV